MKNILVGVCGGIAAYKTASIISLLNKSGYNVKVVMTENATKIITPLTLETLSRNRVYYDMWDEKAHDEVEHISLAHWADLVLIAPTTYNMIGKIANGIADDLLSTIISACTKPIFFALAMNDQMYSNAIFQNNVKKLKEYSYNFIDADEGLLACNYVGKGKLQNENEIVDHINRYFHYSNLTSNIKDKTVLITAGKTKEPIDPIRYISNRSSGKMGYALAQAAIDLGAKVVLVSGPTNIKAPQGLYKYISIESAEQMYNAVDIEFDRADIFISCSAVADYKPKNYSDIKIKKKEGDLVIELDRNKDILLEMSKKKNDKILVGFAAETNNIEENALGKLKKKNLDLIVANSAKTMMQETNSVTIINKNEDKVYVEEKDKTSLSYDIWKEIMKLI